MDWQGQVMFALFVWDKRPDKMKIKNENEQTQPA